MAQTTHRHLGPFSSSWASIYGNRDAQASEGFDKHVKDGHAGHCWRDGTIFISEDLGDPDDNIIYDHKSSGMLSRISRMLRILLSCVHEHCMNYQVTKRVTCSCGMISSLSACWTVKSPPSCWETRSYSNAGSTESTNHTFRVWIRVHYILDLRRSTQIIFLPPFTALRHAAINCTDGIWWQLMQFESLIGVIVEMLWSK